MDIFSELGKKTQFFSCSISGASLSNLGFIKDKINGNKCLPRNQKKGRKAWTPTLENHIGRPDHIDSFKSFGLSYNPLSQSNYIWLWPFIFFKSWQLRKKWVIENVVDHFQSRLGPLSHSTQAVLHYITFILSLIHLFIHSSDSLNLNQQF